MSHTGAISRWFPIVGALGCALVLGACGGDAASSSVAAVRLSVAAPGDFDAVRQAQVTVRGTVKPTTAAVLVRGQKASTSGGSWSAQVSLEPGVNVVDVIASAGRARPALTAVRVRRVVEVEVPDITGLSADDARQALEDAHLDAELQAQDGGFFDELLGGDPSVCATSPEAGTRVDPGTTVVVTLGRRC